MAASVSSTIASLLRQFLGAQQTDPRGLRQLAATLDALPIYVDLDRCVALKASGELLSFDFATRKAVPVADDGLKLRALVTGAEQYAPLKALLPSRPQEAHSCPTCDGSGRERPTGLHGLKPRCGRCHGLGWTVPRSVTPASASQPR